MKVLKLGIAVFFIVFAAGCATVSVDADYDTKSNFSNLKTYSWVQATQPATGDARIDNSLLDSRVRSAVDQSLKARGYVKTSEVNPDFLVGYLAGIEEKTDVTTINRPSTAGMMGGYYSSAYFAYSNSETFVTQYQEGSLLIDIVNPKTKELMWRGTGKATVLENAKPEKREKRISEGVAKILAQFPPVVS